ncbi:MAG: hypothetical protein ABF917_13600, partial [Gluconobacter oxydans]|uniref:hypothetical protein n=1 Tax=Gluconobacter oxydans TaxID=442 RepID=UPI0039E9F925
MGPAAVCLPEKTVSTMLMVSCVYGAKPHQRAADWKSITVFIGMSNVKIGWWRAHHLNPSLVKKLPDTELFTL